MSYYIPIWADCTAFRDEQRKSIIVGYKLVVEHPEPPKNGRHITIPQTAEESKTVEEDEA